MLTDAQIQKLRRSDLNFQTSRSGGKGGQNVNKVESKVELEFYIPSSQALTGYQKKLLLESGSRRINHGTIRIQCQEYRSQLQNRERSVEKLVNLLNSLLKPKTKRIATKPGKSAKEKSLIQKKAQKLKKTLRKKIVPED